MKNFFRRIGASISKASANGRAYAARQIDRAEQYIAERYRHYEARYLALETKKRNRVFVLALSSVLILDYVMICFLVDRNPLNIFPSIPVLDLRSEITIWLPSPDSAEPLCEKRRLQKSDNTVEYIKRLTRLVIEGAYSENTRALTPIEGNVRTVWIRDGICAVDMRLEEIDTDAPFVAGSEAKFRDALSRTIMHNVKGITKVIVLENGIPGKDIWESAAAERSAQPQSGQTPSNTSTAAPDIKR